MLLKLKQGINKKLLLPAKLARRKRLLDGFSLSILSRNCIGGVLSHDYGMPFLSPTVNLSFPAEDFIRFLENLPFYLAQPLTFFKTHEKEGYPVCKLGDLTLYFVHYRDFAEAKTAWERRKKRIVPDRLLCLFTDQEDCTDELVERFSKLPYRKLLFAGKPYPQYDFTVYIKPNRKQQKEGRNPVDDACLFKGLTGVRNYETNFDLIHYIRSCPEWSEKIKG